MSPASPSGRRRRRGGRNCRSANDGSASREDRRRPARASAARRSATCSRRSRDDERRRAGPACAAIAASATSTPRRITATACPSTGSARRCARSPRDDYPAVDEGRPPADSRPGCAARPARLRRRPAVRAALGLFVRRHAAQHRRQPAAARARARSTSSSSTTSRATRTATRSRSAFARRWRARFPALARLKAEGAIAGYGLGVNDWQVCVDALAHADLDILLLAGRYTLLDQTALPELLPLCVTRGTRDRRRRSVQLRHPRDRHASRRTAAHRVLRLRACAAAASSRARPRSRICAPRTAFR